MARDRRPQLRDLECGDPDGASWGGCEVPAVSAARGIRDSDSPLQPCAKGGRFRQVSVCAGEDAREGDSVQCCAAHPEKRWAVRITRLGRKLSGEWAMGGAIGFANQSKSKDRTGTQDCASLLRETRPGGNDL